MHIYFYTVKRKAKPLCELISELKVLLTEDDPQHDIEKTYQCESLCRAIARRPHTLVNAKIRHRFINSDRTLQFYDGQIINYDHKSKKFTIQYDEDDVCNFTIEELVEDCRTEDYELATLAISQLYVQHILNITMPPTISVVQI